MGDRGDQGHPHSGRTGGGADSPRLGTGPPDARWRLISTSATVAQARVLMLVQNLRCDVGARRRQRV